VTATSKRSAHSLPPQVFQRDVQPWAIAALGACNSRDIQLQNARTALRSAAWGEASYQVLDIALGRRIKDALEALEDSLEFLNGVRNNVYAARFDPLERRARLSVALVKRERDL
jgi:hypothetical protein